MKVHCTVFLKAHLHVFCILFGFYADPAILNIFLIIRLSLTLGGTPYNINIFNVAIVTPQSWCKEWEEN